MISNLTEWAETLIKPADVVVVSGDKSTRCLLCDNLSKLKCCVTTSIDDGETAVHHLSRHRPDVLVIDLALLKKSAYGVIQSVRKLYPELPIVVLLNGEPEVPTWLARIGHITLIRKPRDIQIDRLKSMLNMFKPCKRSILTKKPSVEACEECGKLVHTDSSTNTSQ